MGSSSPKFRHVDPTDPNYTMLCACARRIDALLRVLELQSDDGVVASLDLFVGAVQGSRIERIKRQEPARFKN